MSQQQLEQYIHSIQSQDSVEDVTRWLIALGKAHTVNDSKGLRLRENYITGCQNPLWLAGVCDQSGKWQFEADSDIYYVKGIAKIVADTYSDLDRSEIVSVTFHDFKPIAQMLPVQRQRGLQQIINRIHRIVNTDWPLYIFVIQ